jgi:hypothetical protein
MFAIVTKSLLMQAIFYSKLKRIMEYKRRVAKQQFNSKGGRVKKVSSFDNQGPAAKKTRREVEMMLNMKQVSEECLSIESSQI